MCMLESNTHQSTAFSTVVICMSFSTDMQCCSTRLDLNQSDLDSMSKYSGNKLQTDELVQNFCSKLCTSSSVCNLFPLLYVRDSFNKITNLIDTKMPHFSSDGLKIASGSDD